jgi:integrase
VSVTRSGLPIGALSSRRASVARIFFLSDLLTRTGKPRAEVAQTLGMILTRASCTIVETSKKNSPTGERFIVKRYPKNNEPRIFGVRQAWLDEVATHLRTKSIARNDLLFTTTVGTPISRNTFRTQVWLPTVRASGVDFSVRIHDLRHAHASWLLAGGSDLRSVMDRMGHHQIQTTQKYLHTLPDADRKNLDALDRIARGKGT